jgi:hypothetical protein
VSQKKLTGDFPRVLKADPLIKIANGWFAYLHEKPAADELIRFEGEEGVYQVKTITGAIYPAVLYTGPRPPWVAFVHRVGP